MYLFPAKVRQNDVLSCLVVMQSRPEDGDDSGQCSVVQETPARGQWDGV